MLKVIGFTRRHESLTLDQYRLAHVATHASWGRRLKDIRGYTTCVRSNRNLSSALGPLYQQITVNEPADFDNLWDGYGVLFFDSVQAYNNCREPYDQVATGKGLGPAPTPVRELLYSQAPHQFHVDERVIVPIARPEGKCTKIIHFAKRDPGMAAEEWGPTWADYGFLCAQSRCLRGLSLNIRTDYDVVTQFFARTDAQGNPSNFWTPEGIAKREFFYSLWDGIAEIWFDTLDDFIRSRSQPYLSQELAAMEKQLFAASWYREVDEAVTVTPNRRPTPEFYYR